MLSISICFISSSLTEPPKVDNADVCHGEEGWGGGGTAEPDGQRLEVLNRFHQQTGAITVLFFFKTAVSV